MLFASGWHADALELSIPGHARLTHETQSELDDYSFAVGSYNGLTVPSIKSTGRVVRQAWRLEGSDLTTLQILSPIRAHLEQQGYQMLFECSDVECGIFDFRFGISVLDAPEMFVDLYDYRYLSARKTHNETDDEYVSILVSRSGANGYVQVVHAAPPDVVVSIATSETIASPEVQEETIATLVDRGHAVLDDLEFESGATALGAGPYASLADLARYLNEDSTRRVALVGHTDTTGSLEANVLLSRQRAASVLERLVNQYGVGRLQLEADGAGYLSPVMSNLTAEGREANRRVEAILLNTE
ncbi:OmpA family protein [Roseovarius albus]|uniref:OmpA family protein n=1 Tax=Roseovarius albus TaxID=1247867 RepID=UPI00117B4824|nr:OmpA family protein [Roseovarius albus]